MQNAKKRNLILTLLVGFLVGLFAILGLSIGNQRTAFASSVNIDGTEFLEYNMEIGDTLVGKTIEVTANVDMTSGDNI